MKHTIPTGVAVNALDRQELVKWLILQPNGFDGILSIFFICCEAKHEPQRREQNHEKYEKKAI